MTILGVDVSNHQPGTDFHAVKAAGYTFVVLKATEGVGWKDPSFATFRANAHAAGLIVGIYHFARAGDPVAQADYFLSVTGPLQTGEFVVLDDEDPAINPAWVKAWCERIAAKTGVKPMVYMNQSYRDSQDWSGVVADDDALWLARYDGSTAMPPGGAFGSPAMKQYDDNGRVAGIPGPVDLDVFYGTADQLLKYGLQNGASNVTIEDDILANVLAIRQQDLVVLSERTLPAQIAAFLRAPAFDGGPQVSAVLKALFDAIFNGGPSMPDGGKSIGQSLADIRTETAAIQAPVIDEAKLAQALLSDPASVAALGKAIADNLQLAPRSGS